jgi:hypothetical protein
LLLFLKISEDKDEIIGTLHRNQQDLITNIMSPDNIYNILKLIPQSKDDSSHLYTFQKAASELIVLGFQFPKYHYNLANIHDISIDVTLTLSKKDDDLLLGVSDIVQILESILYKLITSPPVGARVPIKIPKSRIIEQELIEILVSSNSSKVIVRKLLKILIVLLDQRNNLFGTRYDRFLDFSCIVDP